MSIVRFDRAVLLANEEPRARDFYIEYLQAHVDKTFVRNREGRELHRSFSSLDEGHGVGLFEDRVAVPPAKRIREWPAVVFEVPQELFDKASSELDGESIDVPVPGAGKTFYTQDPEGNAVGFSVSEQGKTLLLRLRPRDARNRTPTRGHTVRLVPDRGW